MAAVIHQVRAAPGETDHRSSLPLLPPPLKLRPEAGAAAQQMSLGDQQQLDPFAEITIPVDPIATGGLTARRKRQEACCRARRGCINASPSHETRRVGDLYLGTEMGQMGSEVVVSRPDLSDLGDS